MDCQIKRVMSSKEGEIRLSLGKVFVISGKG
jgi:hypothetical protein